MRTVKLVWLLPALLALAIGGALVVPRLAPQAAAQDVGLTRTITVFEGFNLIVWGGTPTAAAELADALPQSISAVFGWQGEQKQFDTWRRTGPDFANTLEGIGPNQAVWVLSDSPTPVSFEQTDSDQARSDSVDGGLDLIGWTALETPIVDALGGLGEIQVNLFDNETKVFRTYTTGLPDALQGATTLGRGAGFWLRAAAGSLVSIPSPLGATTITKTPSADNTIFSEGELSNGAGQNLFAGFTNGGAERRALIKFDLSSIPAGSVIERVEISLTVNKTGTGDALFAIHPLTADWGEGPSDAAANEGRGQAAQPGDATWLERFLGDELPWATPGGDFGDQSAAITIGGEGPVSFESEALTADVQRWLDDPESNFGWILRTLAEGRSAKRFGSREGAGGRPTLTITYASAE